MGEAFWWPTVTTGRDVSVTQRYLHSHSSHSLHPALPSGRGQCLALSMPLLPLLLPLALPLPHQSLSLSAAHHSRGGDMVVAKCIFLMPMSSPSALKIHLSAGDARFDK